MNIGKRKREKERDGRLGIERARRECLSRESFRCFFLSQPFKGVPMIGQSVRDIE